MDKILKKQQDNINHILEHQDNINLMKSKRNKGKKQ